MSIKLMAQVWERKLNKAEQSVLLAMADHAQDDGSKCFPSVDWIAWKTDYSARQVQRTIQALCTKSVLVLVRGYGRGRSNEYYIDLSKTQPKPEYISKGDTVSPYPRKHDTVSPQSLKGDTMSPNSIKDDVVSPQTENVLPLKGDILSVKGDIHDIKGDIAMSPEPLEPPIQPEEKDEEETHAGEPLAVAWQQAYGDTIPAHLTEPLGKLVSERGMAATIHGIKAGAKADSRNFRYIAECARNYVPPAPLASYVNGPSYAVDLPDAPEFNPPNHPVQHLPYKPPAKPPPMSTSDPWTVLVAELSVTLAGGYVPTLQECQLEVVGEIDGEDGRSMPFYRVIVPSARVATLEHFKRQAGAEIQKRLSVILRKRVFVEIVAAEQEQVPA